MKKYANGGLAGISQDAQDLMSSVDDMAGKINYGESGAAMGGEQPLGFNSITPGSLSNLANNRMKKGGKVSSASKRADGCAVRGKTRA